MQSIAIFIQDTEKHRTKCTVQLPRKSIHVAQIRASCRKPFEKRVGEKQVKNKNRCKTYVIKQSGNIPFVIKTRNRYDVLSFDEHTCSSHLSNPQIYPVGTKSKKMLTLRRMKKVTKLECAARGSLVDQNVQCPQNVKRECNYTNPHRTSEFETLSWTKGGFVQTVTLDELTINTKRRCACYTFGRHKHTTKVFRQSCTHMYKLLLLCGDVESNPGPRKSAATRRKKAKLYMMQKREEERKARLEEQEECMTENTERRTSEKRTQMFNDHEEQKEKSMCTATPEQRLKTLETDAQRKSIARSKETPAKRAKRLQTVAQNMSRLRSEETPQKN